MKRILIVTILFCVLFIGCQKNTKTQPQREVTDYNSDWGIQAMNFTNYSFQNEVIVAVLDSGCNLTDERIYNGYNAIENTNNVVDEINHGTIIIQKLLEISPYINIIPIKVYNNEENISVSDLIQGIDKAHTLNADIFSLSLGIDYDDPGLKNKINELIEDNHVIIAAGGNNRQNTLLYPAGYPKVISVLSRDINNKDCFFNNYSYNKKSFSAPGEHIKVNEIYFDGSSIATVFITATVAAIKNENNRVNVDEIINILADASLAPTEISYGLVQFDKALSLSKQ